MHFLFFIWHGGYVISLEFWPDYGQGPLWLPTGVAASPAELGLPEELAARLTAFNAGYEEWKLPMEGDGDPDYLAEGIELLAAVRAAIRPEFEVLVTEPWWGEDPTP